MFGLWKPWLVESLAWYNYYKEEREVKGSATLKELVPSWSWAANTGKVTYQFRTMLEEMEATAQVICIEQKTIDLAESNLFGVGACTLTLKGLCIPVDREGDRGSVLFPELFVPG